MAFTKICRVCGKPYEGCRSAQSADGVFRWREVACSVECGAKYLAEVNAARGITPAPEEPKQEQVAPVFEHHLSKRERRELARRREGTISVLDSDIEAEKTEE